MATIPKEVYFEVLRDVGFAELREFLEDYIEEDMDPRLLLGQTGLRGKLWEILKKHPQGSAAGLDLFTTFIGKVVARRWSTIGGKGIDVIGEAIAHGIPKYVERAQGGQVSSEQVEQALDQTVNTITVVNQVAQTATERQFELLSISQITTIYAVYLAADEASVFDATPSFDNDALGEGYENRNLRCFRGLEGRANRVRAGIPHMLEHDIPRLAHTTPHGLDFHAVYENPRRECDVLVTAAMMAAPHQFLWSILDRIDLWFPDKEGRREEANEVLSSWFMQGKELAELVVKTYVRFHVFMLGAFFSSAALFLLSVPILIILVGWQNWFTALLAIVSYLTLLFFTYVYPLVDSVHNLTSGIFKRLDITREGSMLHTLITAGLKMADMDSVLEARDKNEKEPHMWAKHFGGTAFIAATAIGVIAIMFFYASNPVLNWLAIGLMLMILLAVELNRRTGHKLDEEHHKRNILWMNKWVMRAAVSSILVFGAACAFSSIADAGVFDSVRSEQVEKAPAPSKDERRELLERVDKHLSKSSD